MARFFVSAPTSLCVPLRLSFNTTSINVNININNNSNNSNVSRNCHSIFLYCNYPPLQIHIVVKMVLKRKRSDSEISSSSLLSSPLSFNFMDLDPALATRSMREFTPSHLSSRTRKRYRDNRPSQETIHRKYLY